MALTVNPAVSRSQKTWILHTGLFFTGTLVGCIAAALIGLAVVGLLRLFLNLGAVAIIAASAIIWAVLHDLGVPLPLPYRHRQVPEWLRDALPASAVAVAYGFMLGVGFLTLFTYSAQLAAIVALPFLGSLWEIVAVAAIFAAAKTLVLLGAVGVTSISEVLPRFRWSRRGILVLRLATACVSLVMAGFIVTASS
jgi:hypothetical protein